jgi:hypothetical protein
MPENTFQLPLAKLHINLYFIIYIIHRIENGVV